MNAWFCREFDLCNQLPPLYSLILITPPPTYLHLPTHSFPFIHSFFQAVDQPQAKRKNIRTRTSNRRKWRKLEKCAKKFYQAQIRQEKTRNYRDLKPAKYELELTYEWCTVHGRLKPRKDRSMKDMKAQKNAEVCLSWELNGPVNRRLKGA